MTVKKSYNDTDVNSSTRRKLDSAGVRTAIVLAGGKSVRMGTDKVTLAVGGASLLERAIDNLRPFFSEIIVATNVHDINIADVTVVRDEVPHTGPMGGILAGLNHTSADLVLVRAVDMPLLSEDLLGVIADEVSGDVESDVFVCESGRGIEPLFAVYRKSLSASLTERVYGGDTSLIDFFKTIKVKLISKRSVDAADPGHVSFLNINNSEDVINAIAVLKERGKI